DGDDIEDERSRTGKLFDEHWLSAAGISVHGRVGELRARLRDGQSARLHRAAGSERASLQSEGKFQRGLFAGEPSRHRDQRECDGADSRFAYANVSEIRNTRSRTRRPRAVAKIESIP